MPLAIWNLSKVDQLYISKNSVVAFADEPEFETYNVEIASEDKIKEHLAQLRNWVPQKHETLPEIPSDTAFICSPADYQAFTRFNCRTRKFQGIFTRDSKNCVKSMVRHFQKIMRTLAEPSLSKWTWIWETAHL